MEIIGIICEYNPFHNGHIYHLKKIKELYPDSLIILVLNGYFLERGEISILTKKDKTKIALQNNIDIVLELPVLYGTQSADIFAKTSIDILNIMGVKKIVFGSEINDIKKLTKIVDIINTEKYQKQVKKYLKEGTNYPTALAKGINSNIDFNNPNDLLAISYIKAIKNNNYDIKPISIKRTNDYHDTKSNKKIISASNIRNKIKTSENISKYLPSNVIDKIKPTNDELLFKILKTKILTTPNLNSFLTVDEGIENRLLKIIKEVDNIDDLIKNIKTKRYTYNKIRRMLIHILLGITKEDNKSSKLEYIKILGFNKNGQQYLNKTKKSIDFSLNIKKDSIQYKYEITASLIYDILNNTNTYSFEKSNKTILLKNT